jgi:Mn-dependent DtxR family transcriptional regulator
MNDENSLREIMEDMLRIAAEKKDIIPISILKTEISADDEIFARGIEELENKGLSYLENNELVLTRKGREKAAKILARHEIIEKYFYEILEEPVSHNVAHALEHFVADKTIKRMKEFLAMKERGNPATDFPIGRDILIVAVQSTDKKIVEKIISLGLAPGNKIRVEEKIPNAIIFNIGGRKVALANEIAESILAVVENEGY